MKAFLRHCFFFTLPVVLLLMGMELAVERIPNSYSYKYQYAVSHADSIGALVLGHSQLYDGFMPEAFCLPAFNMSNSSQTYTDNFFLLRELLPRMPKLKMVIMPVGYIDVTVQDNAHRLNLTDRCCYYHKYMHLDYDGQLPVRYRYECLDPFRAGEKLFLYYVMQADIVRCDSMGRRNTNYLCNRKHPLGHRNYIQRYTQPEHDTRKLCLQDEHYLRETFRMLSQRGIMAVMVSPPYFWDYGFSGVNEAQRQFPKERIKVLSREFPVQYIDFESNSAFTYDDFFNETHLSELGAEKFTRMLSEELIRRGLLPEELR